jgi:GDP-mannose 6-dehydrogenase
MIVERKIKSMRISIFGLGYVGLVSAVCLARAGHKVFGIDVNPVKVQSVKEGKSPIVEEYVEDMLAELVRRGRIHATSAPAEALPKTEMSLICVGTPSTTHGIVDLTQVEHVCKQIGLILRCMASPHTVVFRSTMLPGSTRHMAHLLSQYSERVIRHGLHVAFNPEFLREGTAVNDFYSPSYTIVGTDDPVAAAAVKDMYSFLSAPFMLVDVGEAELLKYASNAFHATKITFANEIGRLARALGLDGSAVMRLICQDTSLNISPAYLRPGFAYGGSCLPKDLRALVWKALRSDVPVSLLESLSRSNQVQIEIA